MIVIRLLYICIILARILIFVLQMLLAERKAGNTIINFYSATLQRTSAASADGIPGQIQGIWSGVS